MRIVYLILAHTDPSQLGRLVGALDGANASFFIHIDRKSDLQGFVAAVSSRPNVHFLRERVRVHWGGFSMVEATLALMRAARGGNQRFDYAYLLSGQDYPIKSNQFIRDYFGRHAGSEFISYVSVHRHPFLQWKTNMTWPNEFPLLNRSLHRLRRIRFLGAIPALVFRRGGLPGGLEPHIGSSWWALTSSCVEYILRFAEQNPKFVDFYRWAHAPDEAFFQTIVMNSEFAARVKQEPETATWPETRHRFLLEGTKTKQVRLVKGRSLILDEHDFESLEVSKYLVARKFTTAKSTRLIERIDVCLRGA